ncbi:MAG: hypothetical protein U0802_10630 [Candidatus Binatia bacterium]
MALPAGELLPCVPSFAYDGHYCALREPSAFAAFADFIGALRRAAAGAGSTT